MNRDCRHSRETVGSIGECRLCLFAVVSHDDVVQRSTHRRAEARGRSIKIGGRVFGGESAEFLDIFDSKLDDCRRRRADGRRMDRGGETHVVTTVRKRRSTGDTRSRMRVVITRAIKRHDRVWTRDDNELRVLKVARRRPKIARRPTTAAYQ